MLSKRGNGNPKLVRIHLLRMFRDMLRPTYSKTRNAFADKLFCKASPSALLPSLPLALLYML